MIFTTADLCDKLAFDTDVQIAEPIFRSFGSKHSFSGKISTVKVFEDNVLIHTLLEQKVSQRVLVIDGGGSHRCALLGGNLAKIALQTAGRASLFTDASVTQTKSTSYPSAYAHYTLTR